MKKLFKTLKTFSLVAFSMLFIACNNDDDNSQETMVESTTVVDVAIAGGFNNLAAALTRADLVTTLKGEGPFTVFAPTDAAFNDLLASNDDWSTLNDIPLELLKNVLLNHVIVGSKISASTLITAGSGYATTGGVGVNDKNLSLYYNVVGGKVLLNGGASSTAGATVTTPDVLASNGIIHVIDKVLLAPTIVDFALANPALSSLVAALSSADTQDGTSLIPTLNGEGTFTVFAPANTAFSDLLLELDDSGNTELGDVAPATLEKILLVHVANKSVVSGDLTSGILLTLSGEEIAVDATNFTLTDSRDRVSTIVTTLVDITATNGIVHVIDKVLLNKVEAKASLKAE